MSWKKSQSLSSILLSSKTKFLSGVTMAEDLCFFNKDTLVIKPSKKSPKLLRMTVLVFAMVCGVYICSICLNQISTRTKSKFEYFRVIERPSDDLSIQTPQISTFMGGNKSCKVTGFNMKEIPNVHYPKPQTFSRAECANNPVRFFAIMSMQRSGSGWFETLLNSHINVSSNGEIFNVYDRRKNISSIVKTLDKIYNLDWFNSASKNECSAAVGFKWMLNQGVMAHHKEIVDYFNSRNVSIIFLFRRNLLRRMVSVLANSYDRDARVLNGTHKSHVHSTDEADMLSKYKPSINATTLISDLKQVEKTVSKALEYFNSTQHITLYYEDLVKNHTKTGEVLEFLELPRMDLTSRQVKIHKGELSTHIQNWDDVNKVLKGTTYEHFLQADY